MARASRGNPETAQSADEILFKDVIQAIAAPLSNRLKFYNGLRGIFFYVRQNKWGCFIIETFWGGRRILREFINWVRFTHYANCPMH
jgi:hypothetical protein